MIKRHVRKLYQNKHTREIMIYGIVGICSLIVQDILFIALSHYGMFPTVAMIIGNFTAMFVSYYGHSKFTFKKHKFSKREFVKFTITSTIGLILNAGGVRLITKVFMMNHLWGLLPTFITPIVTFLISKFWAFREKK